MRNAFASEITDLAEENDHLVLLAGDIGNKLFDRFKEAHAERFINCGVAEANMVSVAAGMALAGLRPVTYTINSFATTRCYEQIRVDVCYHHLPVVIVGVGGGLSYATLGATHHSCEDLAIMRVLPNLAVVCPCDPVETRLALRAALSHGGPVYIRLGKKGETKVHSVEPEFKIGEAIVVRPGKNVCILSIGNAMPIALEAADQLDQKGISTQVVSFHTLKPLDEKCLKEVFGAFKTVATLEEHSVLGGLGGAVAEWRVLHGIKSAQFLSFGTQDRFLHEAGDQEYARKSYGLTAEAVRQKILMARNDA